MQWLAVGIGLAGMFVAQVALAQSQTVIIYLKSKKGLPLKDKVITDESVQGIKVKGEPNTITPDDIDDVDYSARIESATIRNKYTNAATAEKNAVKGPKEKRLDQLGDAISKYQDVLDNAPKDQLYARRHLAFKIAYLTAQLGLGSDKQLHRVDGIKKLTEFKKANPDSWQFTPTLMTLIQLHAEQQEFAEMRAVVKELAAANVPNKVKGEGKMLVVRHFMELGKTLLRQKKGDEAEKQFAEAKTELNALLAELPKDSPLRMPAELALAQCKAINKDKKDEATKELKKLLEKVTDKDTRAVIYNTLGEIYYDDGQLQDARWQFLWVDVIYNQDKEEHAKALYYLWKIFNQLSEPERGVEFFEMLASPRLAGTFYQQKALKENKEAQ
jgi:tetratricopeptide (TPR) repeat protein